MNNTIYKYPLSANKENILLLPVGAQVLTIATQNSGLFLWAAINTDAEKEKRVFEVFGTGHYMEPAPRVFLNTFFVNNGEYVFHVFEKI